MTSISITALRKDIYNVVASVNENCEPVSITNNKGKGAVLVGEDEWASIQETLYLMDIPGMTKSILAAKEESLEDCVDADELKW